MRKLLIVTVVTAGLLTCVSAGLHAQAPSLRQVTRSNKALRPPAARQPAKANDKPVVKQLADLVIAKMDPDQDGRAPQLITIRNQGGTTSGPFVIGIRVYNAYEELLYEMEIYQRRQLPPHASTTRRMYLSNFGDRWSIRIDSRNQVRESNENNNAWANERER